MEKIITIGLDLAKSVFQVHGIGGDGNVVVRRALRRSQVLDFFRGIDPCLVGIEACASSHYWANAIGQLGHKVRMMPPTYVKAYVKRNKTDAAHAEAICEAVSRPTMRFVPIKAPDEQAACMVLRTRELFVRQRSQTANAMRAHMAELGIIAATGMTSIAKLIRILRDAEDTRTTVEAVLDQDFFSVRVAGLPDRELGYLRALASLGPGEHTPASVAAAMNRSGSASVGSATARLVSRGLIYSTRRGYVAFTVPQFDRYVRRTFG